MVDPLWPRKTSGAGFYLHIAAKEVVIAVGVYMPEREQLFAIRSWLLEHHAEFRKLLEDRKLNRAMDIFEGLPLTRAPKGFPADHPALDLIRCRQWGVSATLSADAALTPSLVNEVVSRFRLASPLVHALNRPLVPRGAPRPNSISPLY